MAKDFLDNEHKKGICDLHAAAVAALFVLDNS